MKPFLLAITVLTLSGCGLAGDWSVRSQIKRYRGDGTIYTCSNTLSGGYSIDFARFDASKPFTATYTFSNVPQIYNHPYFYMRHGSYPKDEIPPDDVRARLTGKYEFTLRDQSGNVTHVEVPIAKAIWGSRGIYDLDKSELKLKKNTNYELQVSYSPGEVPPPLNEFYFVIDNCAYY